MILIKNISKRISFFFCLSILSFACHQETTKNEKITETDKVIDDNNVLEDDYQTQFISYINQFDTKEFPINENTNFDQFIEAEMYQAIDDELLALIKVYPNWHEEGYNYEAIKAYRIPFSSNYHSIAVTVLKGDAEMETQLINYDLQGNYIDNYLISYDEIAEGLFSYRSYIEENSILIRYYNWLEEDYEKMDDAEILSIEQNGFFRQQTVNEYLFALLQDSFQLDSIVIPFSAIRFSPNYSNVAYVVLAELAEDYGDEMFGLNSHIAAIDIVSQTILAYYYESQETNGWISDAIRITDISIDATPYLFTEDTEGFGVRVTFEGASRANPYFIESLDLFTVRTTSIEKIYNDLIIFESHGEWDTNCAGIFDEAHRDVSITGNESFGIPELRIETEYIYTEQFETDDGDCDYRESTRIEETILLFNGEKYELVE